ncbi:MAG: RNA polymerase sigma factor [Planctomycetota bacterium]
MPRPDPVQPEGLLEHASFVRSLASALVRDPHLADDLSQETLAAALEQPPGSIHGLRAWLRGVLIRRAHQHRRSEARRGEHHALRAEGQTAAFPAVDEALERADLGRRLVGAVMDLPEPYRTTIVLRFLEDLPPRRIAALRGVPVNTVRTHLERGLERLRARLEGESDSWVRGLALLAALPAVDRLAPAGAGASAAALCGALAVAVAAVWISVTVGTGAARERSTSAPKRAAVATSPAPGGGLPLVAASPPAQRAARSPSEPTPARAEPKAPAALELRKRSTLRVQLGALAPAPAAQVRVRARGSSAETPWVALEEGEVELVDLPAGRYDVLAVLHSSEDAPDPDLSGRLGIDWPDPRPWKGRVSLRSTVLDEGASASVTVFGREGTEVLVETEDAPAGLVFALESVGPSPTLAAVATDDGRRARFTAVQPGRYMLQTVRAGEILRREPLTVPQLDAGPFRVRTKLGAGRVRVDDPVADHQAPVHLLAGPLPLSPTDDPPKTVERSSFTASFGELLPGRYRLWTLRASGESILRDEFELERGQLHVARPAAGAVLHRLDVTVPDSVAEEDVALRLLDDLGLTIGIGRLSPGEEVHTWTASAGRYRVLASTASGGRAYGQVDLRGDHTIVLRGLAADPVALRIERAGQPLSAAAVCIAPAGFGGVEESGRFRLPTDTTGVAQARLAPGRYEVSGENGLAAVVDLQSGVSTVTVLLVETAAD